MGNKILITGVDSFTGHHLSSFFKNHGYNVYGTSLTSSSENIYKCDITIKEQVAKIIKIIQPDYLIHLAGISFYPASVALISSLRLDFSWTLSL